MPLTETDLAFFRELVMEHSAIALEPDENRLVEARLDPIARELGLKGARDLLPKLRGSPFGSLHEAVVAAMTAVETSFFGDLGALEKTALPELIERRRATRRLTIWSAAAATGQEPYSICMTIRESFPELDDWDLRILGTDLAAGALERARQGLYCRSEVEQGLPERLLAKYFRRSGLRWQIEAELRGMVTFQQLNLIKPCGLVPDCDIILMRNVLLYYDHGTQREILARVGRKLAGDGYLFLGAAGPPVGIEEGFRRVLTNGSNCFARRDEA